MTKPEVASLLALIKEYYPRDIDNSNIQIRTAAWHYILKDYSYELGKAAVISFVSQDTKGFSPVVGQLVEQIHKLMRPEKDCDEMAAWDIVRKATRSASMSLSSRHLPDPRTSAEVNFDSLPADIQYIVHSPEQLATWASLPEDVLNSVIQSNFLKTYRNRQKIKNELQKLPQVVGQTVKNLSSNMLALNSVSENIEGGTYD